MLLFATLGDLNHIIIVTLLGLGDQDHMSTSLPPFAHQELIVLRYKNKPENVDAVTKQ